MAEIHNFPELARVEQEASDWIARLHAEQVSEEDRVGFLAWRAAHPTHARVFDGMSAVWQALHAAAADSASALPLDARPAGLATARRGWFAAAAAILLILGAVWMMSLRRPPEMVLQTGLGERVSIALADHSVVDLNSNTRLRVDYSPHARRIRLERGEAFFSVRPDAARPFWVIGHNSAVRAVGTEFGVYLRGDGVRVTVSEGAVHVGFAARADVTDAPALAATVPNLKAGQQAEVRDGAIALRTLSEAQVKRSLAWRTGRLSFEQQSLDEVLQEFSRYSSIRFDVTDPELRQLEIGGSFPAGPESADALVRMLQDGFGLQVRREGAVVYIAKPRVSVPLIRSSSQKTSPEAER